MSDVNLTVQEGSDVYLSLTETPAVVSVTNPLVAAASFSVTVGTSVTVSNFPATQGISGTVTANVSAVGNAGETIPDGALVIGLEVGGTLERVSNNVPLPVTAVGAVTIGSLPAISGTVTANLSGSIANEFENGLNAYAANYNDPLPIALPVGVASLPVSGTVTASLSSANLNSVTVGVRGSVTVANFPATQVVSVSNFPSSSSVTIGGFSTSSLPPSTVTVANTVTVALDANSLSALENVTVTVGAAVTVAGFSTSSLPPSTVTVGNTVTINGTVTANVIGLNYSNGQAPAQLPIREDFDGTPFVVVGPSSTPEPFLISGTVTANVHYNDINNGISSYIGDYGTFPISGTVTVGNSVTIGSLPAISGTVTVSNVAGFNIPTHDFKSFAYTSGNLTQIAYRTGGASGTTVGILTLAYDGSGNLTSMTRT